MPNPMQITLTPAARCELEQMRDRAAKAYLRERAAAILKVADGQSVRQVAATGLLKRRKRQTVSDWVHRYRAEGIKGLSIRKGRGRRPAFSPTHPDETSAQEAILHIVRREPACFGHAQSRWTLEALAHTCAWLRLQTLGGLSQLLKRLGIRLKRARAYIHSPDPAYAAKVSYLTLCRMRAWYEPERYVFLYLDEFGYYRQPTLSRDYEVQGHRQPLARRSYRSNTLCRGIGALNAITGQVIYRQYSKISLRRLSAFYVTIHDTYPDAQVIYVAQDNWPVHVHPDVLVSLEPQQSPFWPCVPANWPQQPRQRAVRDALPIQLLFLPTYAAWLNPIEKLWRWVRQAVIHLHRLSDDWPGLKQRVLDFMEQFATGSIPLLRYTGLLSD